MVGRAQAVFPTVELFAIVFMSNHFHAIARGLSIALPFFVGFIKREISRRLGARPDVDWPGTMWHEYVATALPTHESQIRCLKYVLAQSVKEGLVERPQDWPGVHCAKPLMHGTPMHGNWFDATAMQRAKHAQSRRLHPEPVRRTDYLSRYEVVFSPLPAWSELTVDAQKVRVAELVSDLCDEARVERNHDGATVIGADTVTAVSRERRTTLPKLPWFENRKRMICWANPRDPIVREYLNMYWEFQRALNPFYS